MRSNLLRTLSLWAPNLLLSPSKLYPNLDSIPKLAQLAVSNHSRFIRIYSSKSDSTSKPKFSQTQKPSGFTEDAGEISTQEIKKLVEKYYGGDEEEIPSIFEAILKRKLAGIPDDELIKELNLKSRDEIENIEFDSDLKDDLMETDEDSDDKFDGKDAMTGRLSNEY